MKLSIKFCLGIILLYLVAAGIGEVRYQRARILDETPSYARVNAEARYVPPLQSVGGTFYMLGTDGLGRSVGERLVQGARVAFIVGVVTSIAAIMLGGFLGLLGGYFGGWVDSCAVWLAATVASMPGLLYILAISLVIGKGMLGMIVGIGLTTWVGVFRTVRAEVMKHRSRAYVLAARTIGYSHGRIMFRHILPNIAHLVLIQFSIRFPSAVATEVFISFLGIGVQGEPSWGVMINHARLRLWQGIWWEMTFTTLAIFFLVLSFNHLADYLRDRLDPALRSERERL